MKTNNKLIVFGIILFVCSLNINTIGQVVYVPLNDPIYEYLDRMNIKDLISLNSEKKPFSRVYIANKLLSLRKNQTKLNRIDQELLKWYELEFQYELKKNLKNYNKNSPVEYNNNFKHTITLSRWRLVDYIDSQFSFRLSPIVGGNITFREDEKNYSGWIGLRTWITNSDWFGGMLDIRNVGEFGDFIDKDKFLTPSRGFDEGTPHPNGTEWSDVRSQINFNWDWGVVSIKKDYEEWGNSYFGNLIVSDKAPSYPHLTFEIKPVEWFRFYYKFGWLHSGIIDSSRTIVVNPGDDPEVLHQRFVKKYFVANMLTFTPTHWLDCSIGNSFVYAGDFRSEMMVPFNFYKYMDRNTGKKSIEDGNGAFFLDLVVRLPKTFKFYSTLFFDVDSKEGSLGTFLNKAWYGFTVGGKKVDLILNNFDIIVEYTKINPWVYEHKYRSLTDYKHLEYSIGHWIGENADQFKLQFSYQPLRGLRIKFWGEYIRKGGQKDIKYAYLGEEMESFLYHPLRKDKYVGININYEIIHEFFIESSFIYSSISDEDDLRTQSSLLGKYGNANLAIYYGIP